MNRLQDRIDKVQAKVDSGEIPEEKLAALDKDLATEWKELVEYQNLQSLAFASGKITLDEANQLYRLLGGENPTVKKWDELSIATRVAITQMMSELLSWRIGQGKGAKYTAAARKSKPGSRKPEPGTGLSTLGR